MIDGVFHVDEGVCKKGKLLRKELWSAIFSGFNIKPIPRNQI